METTQTTQTDIVRWLQAGKALTNLLRAFGKHGWIRSAYSGLDSGVQHGPFAPPCADCGAVVAYGGHNDLCPMEA